MKLKLFQQNPTVEKYKPDSALRQIESLDIDRKEDLERFRAWMEGAAKEKSELPDQGELDELNKQATSGRGISLGLLGVMAAIPLAGLALGGGFTGLSKIANDAMSAITGGGDKPGAGAGNDNLLGIDPENKSGVAVAAVATAGGAKLIGKAGKKLPTNVKPTTPKAPKVSRPASSTPRSNAAGNQVSPGQQSRTNSNRATKPGQTPKGVTQPRNPSPLKGFKAKLETGTAFGGKGSGLQKRFHKLFSGKNPLQGFIKKIFGTKVGRKALVKTLGGFFRKIPLVGALLGFLIDITLGGETAKRAGFKAAGAALGGTIFSGILGALGSIVPIAGNAIGYGLGLWGGMEFGSWFGGWLHDRIFKNGQAAKLSKVDTETTEEQLLYGEQTEEADAPAGQPLRGSQQTTQNQTSTGTGNVNQWLHGNPNRAGYDAGHAGQANAHDHFSFNSRESAVKAYRALKAAGYKITEFEGYGKYTRNGMRPGSHSAGGGHFGPVGGAPTYNDLSDGTAFDIPWSSYGSGPITQKDYDLSFKAAQIVGAVGGGGGSNAATSQTSGESPDYGQGRTEEQQSPQKSFQQAVTKMLEPMMPIIKLFEYMSDKELMDKTVIYGRDPETGLPIPNFKPVKPAPVKQDMVSVFTQAAEQAQGDVVIIQGGQTVVPSGGSESAPSPNIQASGGSGGTVFVGGGFSFPATYRGLMATKLKN